MIQQEWLYKKLAEDLSKERLITKQVEDYITDHYGYSVEDLPRFFTEKVSQLEDYEIDLTFSPLFTPTLEDRAGYIPILVDENLSKTEVKQVVDQLVAKNIYGHFITPNRQNLPMVLTDVCINRFVERLYLDRPIHPDVFQAIELVVPEKDRPMAQVLARKPNWQAPWRQQFLVALLKTADA
ncbi:MAG: hypothetical protein K2X66_08030, partial [Cyanobacteria bacterium]|nr:hypothetical protein [Cyanobacteriota bacterium]